MVDTAVPEQALSGLVRAVSVPAGFVAPRELRHEDLVAQAITRDHLDDDVAGINRSVELIADTRGGGWPTEPVTAEGNFVDLVWHECEFRDAKSFTYAVYRDPGVYIGCCYLYPVGVRVPMTAALLHHDIDVSWWVTPEAFASGYYDLLHRALGQWVSTEFPFSAPYYSNARIPGGSDS